jgi:type II secretory pathway predicted ATPase ExeA
MSQAPFKAHFGFLTEPFSKEIATKALFISEQLKALFERLQHFIARRGIALITGDVGAGKSTALRAFTETLDKNHHVVVYVEDPSLGLRGMLSSIARQLNLNAKYFKWQLAPELKAAIEKNFADYHQTTLLIIDDAQHLGPQALDELRLLTNFHIDSKAPLSLVLLAQPEFRKIVQLKALEAFRQRLTLRVHLTGLAQSEAAAYVKHQLEMAGRTDTLFTDDVIAEIYQQAKGIPRLINTLCYECLLDIYQRQKNVVDMPTLEKVLCQYDNW